MTSPQLAQAKTGLGDEYLTELLQGQGQPQPSQQISESIRSYNTSDSSPRRPLSLGQRISLSLILCVGVTVGFALLLGYHVTGAAAAALYGVLAWASIQAGLLFASLGKPGRLPTWARAVLVLGVPLGFFVFLGLSGEGGSFAEFLAGHPGGIIRCGGFALAAGMVTAFGIMFLWRRTDPFAPGFSGSIAGLVGGLSGALAIGLVCRDHGAWHLWLGHGLCVVALIVLGRAIGRRWLAP